MSALDRVAALGEKVGAGDTACAETELPLAPAALLEFLSNSERLFRLNPHLEIETWQSVPGGFRLVAQNESNGRRIELTARIAVTTATGTLALSYDGGLKQGMTLAIEPVATGARLIVTEHYPRVEDPQDPRLVDVDRSLVPWVTAIRRHLIQRQRWGWLPGWQWWNERFMLGMPPRHRRIVWLLIWTTLLEFIVFLGVVIIWRLAA